MATIKEGHPLYKGKTTLPTPRAKYDPYMELFKERSPRIIGRSSRKGPSNPSGNGIIRKSDLTHTIKSVKTVLKKASSNVEVA